MGIALSLNLSSTISTLTGSTFGGALQSPAPVLSDTPKDEDLSDNDEPLLSGSGISSWERIVQISQRLSEENFNRYENNLNVLECKNISRINKDTVEQPLQN